MTYIQYMYQKIAIHEITHFEHSRTTVIHQSDYIHPTGEVSECSRWK
jgi:hypothetical protein